MQKLEKLRKDYFKDHPECDALMITGEVNRRYLLEFASSAGTLVIFPEISYFIIDFRYIEAAKAKISGCEIQLQGRLWEQLKQLFQKHRAKRIGLEDHIVTIQMLASYRKQLPQVDFVENSGLTEFLERSRMIKTPEEIARIAKAQQMADDAFTEILNFIRPGVTEQQIAIELEYSMKKRGAEDLSFQTIAVAGKNSSLPHGVPSEYPIASGDFVTMDFGAVADGYHSDMTRTVAVGQISEQQRHVYDTVLKAQLMALDAIEAGMRCSEIDHIARDYIDQSGYQGCFGHGLGHSVGLEIHEEPRFSPVCDVILEDHMIMTVEPGVYLEGQFGVRIEDFVVIEGDSVKNLTKSEKNLISL